MARLWHRLGLGALAAASLATGVYAQASAAESAIEQGIGGLRRLDDATRARETKRLALQIRALPAGESKVGLAYSLANLSTEGDFGRDTLQEVATTLAGSLREHPQSGQNGEPNPAYLELAQLQRYEHMRVSLNGPEYRAALAQVDRTDAARRKADFTLADLDGKRWTLSALHGKVVLVNFWATWCPPCRKEMPDLNALYQRFKSQGFVILAISDEEAAKVKPFIAQHGYAYPILLDPGRKVNDAYQVDGIPKSFVYDRGGKLVAQSIDMRTQNQFLAMLAKAGLK